MKSTPQGSLRLFQYSGIEVFLHWSWFLVAVIEIEWRGRNYSSITWNILEYLGLFLIVLVHEFGHSLACRQVGGTANRIVLWPLGGVAYVNPPQRPGATLWSIAAGPLVNVAFLLISVGLWFASGEPPLRNAVLDSQKLLWALAGINLGLLIFNLLPIYPLDGGQILRSLLWFMLGRGRSLMVAVVIGFVGVAGLIALAVWTRDAWLALISVFILMNCWNGLKQARALLKLAKLPRHPGFACPSCETAPPIGAFWKCSKCGQAFDTFQTGAACPNCAAQFPVTMCLDCRALNPMSKWIESAVAPIE